MDTSIQQTEIDEDNRVQALLKDYEFCTIDANHLEDSIWTATGILITASVAGIGLLGNTHPKGMYDLSFRTGLAILSIIIIYIWSRIVTRWYSIQQVMYYRTQEIEKELGMFKNRYVKYLDDHKKKSAPRHDPQFVLLQASLGTKYRGSTVRNSVSFIKWVLIGIWVGFVLLQFLLTFHKIN